MHTQAVDLSKPTPSMSPSHTRLSHSEFPVSPKSCSLSPLGLYQWCSFCVECCSHLHLATSCLSFKCQCICQYLGAFPDISQLGLGVPTLVYRSPFSSLSILFELECGGEMWYLGLFREDIYPLLLKLPRNVGWNLWRRRCQHSPASSSSSYSKEGE